jgi:hypothetical protein
LLSLRRCIQKLRKKVRNKACAKAGIVEAFLVKETANTLSLYFRPHAPSVRNKVPRYDDCASSFQGTCDLDIFKCPGHCMSPRGVRELSNKEYKVAFLYILTNMLEMDAFFTYVLPKTSFLFCFRFFLLYRHNQNFVHVDTLIMNSGRAI